MAKSFVKKNVGQTNFISDYFWSKSFCFFGLRIKRKEVKKSFCPTNFGQKQYFCWIVVSVSSSNNVKLN